MTPDGCWVAYDRDTPVLVGRPGTSRHRLRKAALDDWGVPAEHLRLEWRPTPKPNRGEP